MTYTVVENVFAYHREWLLRCSEHLKRLEQCQRCILISWFMSVVDNTDLETNSSERVINAEKEVLSEWQEEHKSEQKNELSMRLFS